MKHTVTKINLDIKVPDELVEYLRNGKRALTDNFLSELENREIRSSEKKYYKEFVKNLLANKTTMNLQEILFDYTLLQRLLYESEENFKFFLCEDESTGSIYMQAVYTKPGETQTPVTLEFNLPVLKVEPATFIKNTHYIPYTNTLRIGAEDTALYIELRKSGLPQIA